MARNDELLELRGKVEKSIHTLQRGIEEARQSDYPPVERIRRTEAEVEKYRGWLTKIDAKIAETRRIRRTY